MTLCGYHDVLASEPNIIDQSPPLQEKTPEPSPTYYRERPPTATPTPTEPPPPTESIPPTNTPTLIAEVTDTPTTTPSSTPTATPTVTLVSESEEGGGVAVTESAITPPVAEQPETEIELEEDEDIQVTEVVVVGSPVTEQPIEETEETAFEPEGLPSGAVVTTGAVAVGMGIAVGILLSNRRKKKQLLAFAEDCPKIRKKNKDLLAALKQNQKLLKTTRKKLRAAWNKYRKLLRQPMSTPDTSVEDLERQREKERERYRKDMGWVKKRKAGWVAAGWVQKRYKQRMERITRKINELLGQRRKSRADLQKSRDQARDVLQEATKAHKQAISEYWNLLSQLKKLFQEYGRCKDCCELEKIIAQLQKEIEALEQSCKQFQDDLNAAKKREQDERKAAEDAEQAARRATPKDLQKDYEKAQKDYQKAKQALRDFINTHLFHSGITTDPTLGRSWKGYQGIGLDDEGEVMVFAKDQAAWEALMLLFDRGKAKLQKLKEEANRARNRIEQLEDLKKYGPEAVNRLKKKAKYHRQNERDAGIEKSMAEVLLQHCKNTLGDLKRILETFKVLFEKCKKKLQDCRDTIRNLNKKLREKRKELEECKKKLQERISTLQAQKKSLQRLSRYIPALKKTLNDVIEALKKAEECLGKTKKLPKPKFQTPGKGKCGKLENCREKLNKLKREIEATQSALDTCRKCKNNANVKIKTVHKAIAETLGADLDITKEHCCNTRIWIGYGFGGGGILIFGREFHRVSIFCLDNPDHYVTIVSTEMRFGLGLGGEAQAILAFIYDAEHIDDVLQIWKEDIMGGLDFDFSIGIPVTKLAKYIWKGLKARRLFRLIRRLSRMKIKPPAIGGTSLEVLKEAAITALSRSVRQVPLKMAKKGFTKAFLGKASHMQVALPRGIAFPIGPALQIGVWWRFWSKIHVNEFRCCDCTSQMYRLLKDGDLL
jgi:methyl-accepting chemotaxis protein